MKKVTSIKIDEDVFKKAKMEIPNLSLFIEDCLKVYLGISVDNNYVGSMQDNLNIIKDAQLKIHLLSKSDFNNREVKEFDSKKCNDNWLKVWGVYRNTETIHEATVNTVAETLKVDYDYLVDMMKTLLLYVPKNELSFCDNWDYAEQKYEKILNGVD